MIRLAYVHPSDQLRASPDQGDRIQKGAKFKLRQAPIVNFLIRRSPAHFRHNEGWCIITAYPATFSPEDIVWNIYNSVDIHTCQLQNHKPVDRWKIMIFPLIFG